MYSEVLVVHCILTIWVQSTVLYIALMFFPHKYSWSPSPCKNTYNSCHLTSVRIWLGLISNRNIEATLITKYLIIFSLSVDQDHGRIRTHTFTLHFFLASQYLSGFAHTSFKKHLLIPHTYFSHRWLLSNLFFWFCSWSCRKQRSISKVLYHRWLYTNKREQL